jgi:hypothetical protein
MIAYSSREKICRKNRKAFRMSRKIDAACKGLLPRECLPPERLSRAAQLPGVLLAGPS